MKLKSTLLAAAFALTTLTAHAGTLWYNGDFDLNDGLTSEHNGGGILAVDSFVYDNFVVASGTANVNSVFGYFLSDTSTVLGAQFEIRQSVTSGDGGTLVASGSDASPAWNATATTLGDLTLYQLTMSVSGVALSPGTYWLGLRPVLDPTLDQNAYAASTSGDNATGFQPGNAYIDSPFLGYSFALTTDSGYPADYSYGVNVASASPSGVPEPATVSLALAGFAALLLSRRRRA